MDTDLNDDAIFDVLQKAPDRRKESDLALLAKKLRYFSAFDDLTDEQLRLVCRSVTYEYHPPNSCLFHQGDPSSSWFVILHGSVMMDTELYSTGSMIGKPAKTMRTVDCLVLDPTDFLVITDEIEELNENLVKSLIAPPPPISPAPSASFDSAISSAMSAVAGAVYTGDHSVSSGYSSPSIQSLAYARQESRPLSSSSSESIGERAFPPTQQHLVRSGTTSRIPTTPKERTTQAEDRGRRHSEADVKRPVPMVSGLGMLQEEMQHLIDQMGTTATKPSGIIMTPHPGRTKEKPRLRLPTLSFNIDDLQETSVDSDEDDDVIVSEVTSSRDSLSDIQDPVYDSLEKSPVDRTPSDIDSMHDYLQYLPAFSGLSETIRRDLCAKMALHKFLYGMEVVPNGRELSSWYVILYGQLELSMEGKEAKGPLKTLFSGEAFGITPEASKSIHQGSLVVKSDHCKILEVKGEDFKEILHSGEQNIRTVTDEGKPVLVQEQRSLGRGDRMGYVIIRGTKKRLLDQLIEANPADPFYAEDFLLCHRTFIEDPSCVARQLLEAFEDVDQRAKATRVMLLWVNNHFGDFDGIAAMMECIEKFRERLDEERMGEHQRLLEIAMTTKAKKREIVIKRDDVTTPLGLTIIGKNDHVYVTSVEEDSLAEKANIRITDEILVVNDVIVKDISFARVQTCLSDGKKFRLQVKCSGSKLNNLTQSGAMPLFAYSDDEGATFSSPYAPGVPPRSGSFSFLSKQEKHKPKTFSGFFGKLTGRGKRPKTRPLVSNVFSPLADEHGRLTPPMMRSREQTPDSDKLSPPFFSQDDSGFNYPMHQSCSMPAIPMSPPPQLSSNIDHVIKVYKSDGVHCYIPVSNHTTASNLVALAVKEFALQESSSDFSLCQITVSEDRVLQQKRLPDVLDKLPERLSLHSRYYIKPHCQTGSLVQDEVVDDILKESGVHLLQLDLKELVRHLTLTDFDTFRSIDPEEYIRDLFDCGVAENLAEFAEVVNREMFWVVTEICREPRLRNRVKLIKVFIKLARLCKQARNFNSMFAIVSGLGHQCVRRLKLSWERLPSKYLKAFEDMQRLMDPTRNMIKYRTVICEEGKSGPVIPFFPVIKKDLMVLYLMNESKVKDLINFEKLRKLSKEIRTVGKFASKAYDPSMVFGPEVTASSSGELLLNPSGTLKKRSGVGHSVLKKMYEMKLMEKKVKEYVYHLPVMDDENALESLSIAREPAPTPTAASAGVHLGPRASIAVMSSIGGNGRTSPQGRAMSVGSRPTRKNSASPHMVRRLSVHGSRESLGSTSGKKRLSGSLSPFKKRKNSSSSRLSQSCSNSPLAQAKNH
eukprot:m.310452 g.310452  ORF g.310452 m.310452 type:complete len:1329 (+) comp51709_c0_seq1:116-4102(+)